MNEYKSAKLEGAKIFRLAIHLINEHGWDHNSMEILLSATPGRIWPQPMAVLMYSELENQLGAETLTAFDKRVSNSQEVIELFSKVAENLESN